jgi:phage shock protein A
MDIFSKLLTALRGAATEAGFAAVDSQAFRIAQQEQRDAELALARARRDLTLIMAEEIKGRRRLEQTRKMIAEREEQARGALRQGNESLARQIAARLAALTEEETQWADLTGKLGDRIERLRQALASAEARLAEFRRRYSVSKATASAQRAEGLTLSSSGSGASSLSDAETTLDRIGRQQEDWDARFVAIASLSAQTPDRILDGELRGAGLAAPLRPDPEAILLRLRSDISPE